MKIRQLTREEFKEELIIDLKAAIPFETIGKFLPFQTRIVSGHNHNHIQTDSIFVVKHAGRTLTDGDTLCQRKSPFYLLGAERETNCPGCEAIGREMAVEGLL